MGLHSISLFSGVGMLDEGLRAGLAYLGISHRTVCHVEREAYGAAVLAARMEDGSLDAAPVWSDVCTFDARAWRGRVDCIVAGFPCQDLSVAGRRAGLDGARSGLFFEVLRIADDSDAWCLFLENVAGIATATATVVDTEEGELDERAVARVVGELADRGWDAEWLTLSAADVGASHGRERWFCFAWRRDMAHAGHHARGTEREQQHQEQAGRCRQSGSSVDDAQRVELAGQRLHQGPGSACSGAPDAHGPSAAALADTDRRPDERRRGSGAVAGPSRSPQGEGIEREWRGDAPYGGERCVADSSCRRRPEGRSEPGREQGRPDAHERGGALADAGQPGLPQPERGELRGAGWWLEGRAAQQLRGAPLLFAPGPADPRWPAILADYPELAPALEPDFRSLVDGVAFDMGDSRAPRLKCVGNGVVALCAAAAFVELARRAGMLSERRAPMREAA